MKIVLLDGYTVNPGDLSWEKIKELGEFTYYDRTGKDREEIIKRIGDNDIVITNKTPIDSKTLDACPSIKYIALLSTGYNVVDVMKAREKGIPVSNIPTYGTDSVAQYAIALLLELCHHIGHHGEEVRKGRWENTIDWCFWDYPLIELSGKTIGIFGFGRLGKRTAEIAKPLNMGVIVSGSDDRAYIDGEGWSHVRKKELFENSDVISLHAPLNENTKNIINSETISLMKDGVLIINTARGGLIDEEALASALESGKVGGLGADVVSTEPIEPSNPLLKAKNCIITPHMAWGAKEARERIISTTLSNIKAFMEGKPENLVN